MIIQSSSNSSRRYYGPVHALIVITAEERPSPSSSLIYTLYNPRILIPTILVYSIGPCIRFLLTAWLEDELAIDPLTKPIVHSIASIVSIAIECIIVTPLELARKRIFAQPLDAFKRERTIQSHPIEGCIEMSPAPYTGVLNCLASVMSEEGGKLRKKIPMSHEDRKVLYNSESSQNQSTFGTGFRSIFRGFWTRYASALLEHYTYPSDQGFLIA